MLKLIEFYIFLFSKEASASIANSVSVLFANVIELTMIFFWRRGNYCIKLLKKSIGRGLNFSSKIYTEIEL